MSVFSAADRGAKVTPADRLDALHDLAEAVRAGLDCYAPAEVVEALKGLDAVERGLGFKR